MPSSWWTHPAFYPQSAVLGGWVAPREYYAANEDILQRIIRGWAEAKDYMVRNPKAAAEALQQRHYQRASIAEALKAQKMFSSRECDGTVVKWLQQVSDFFMTEAGVTTATPATDYFDSSLHVATVN
jgi:NitT/TauT family transport system substrate-binding protein